MEVEVAEVEVVALERPAVLVSRRWGEAWGRPYLWSWVTLPVASPSNFAEVLEMMKSSRMQKTKCLVVEGLVGEQVVLLVEEVARHEGLEDVVMGSGSDLSAVPTELLVKAVTKVAKVSLREVKLTAEQIAAIFAALVTQHCRLASLAMAPLDLRKVLRRCWPRRAGVCHPLLAHAFSGGHKIT